MPPPIGLRLRLWLRRKKKKLVDIVNGRVFLLLEDLEGAANGESVVFHIKALMVTEPVWQRQLPAPAAGQGPFGEGVRSLALPLGGRVPAKGVLDPKAGLGNDGFLGDVGCEQLEEDGGHGSIFPDAALEGPGVAADLEGAGDDGVVVVAGLAVADDLELVLASDE